MLTEEENRLLTRVEGDAPMGRMMRDLAWVPAVRAARLEAGGAPIRLRFFGRNFIGYRSPDGAAGFMDEACPHRGASLALAANEPGGLRCIFHGWKFDPCGQAIECPTQAEGEKRFAATIRTGAYQVRESGGILWAYLGSQDVPPPLPDFPFVTSTPENMMLASQVVACNWLQGLEAAFDAAHVGILHQGFLPRMIGHGALTGEAPPRYELKMTPYGFEAAAIRLLSDGRQYVRTCNFALPWAGFPGTNDSARPDRGVFIAVPIDDTHTLQWLLKYNPVGPLTTGLGVVEERYDPDNYCPVPGDPAVNWGQDREAMRNGHFSGFPQNVLTEDMVVQVSMGPIVDRTKEHLSTSDLAIVHARRLLLRALDEFERGGTPFGQQDRGYARIQSKSAILAKGEHWVDALA